MTKATSKILAIILVAVTAVLIATVAVMRVMIPSVRHVELDPMRYPVRGIDISAHNGAINFDSVAASGIKFVYIKASEGGSHRDSLFRRNAFGAAVAGMRTGAYHFFRFDVDGHTQAMNFLAAIDSVPLNLPVAVDVEEYGNPADVSTELIASRLQTILSELRARVGHVVIYTNKRGLGRFFRDSHADYHIWICSFTDPPTGAEWLLWQHSHIGRVPGIKGKVDLDVFNGNDSLFTTWPSR